jgi:phosphatidyl-myo-inositol dimannoside synthase
MRALLLAESLVPESGWGTYALGVVRGLAALGVHCRVLTDYRAEPVAPTGVWAIPRLSTPLGALDRPRSIAWNAAQVVYHARGADLVHSLVEPYAMACWLPGLPPSILSVHGTYTVSPLHGERHTRLLYRRALRRAQRVLCSSRFTARTLRAELPLDTVEVIPLGHDLALEEIPPSRSAEPAGNGPVLLSVGALKERKGLHVSLRAAARLRERFPDLRYYLVGDDADRKYVERLRREIAELGLRDRAVITGRLPEPDLREMYRRADLFVLAPLNVDRGFEGFGIVYLEASAHGVPAIGTLACGAEDAIEDGVNGFLVPQNDANAIAERAARILGDPGLARRMGEAGRARASEQTLRDVARRYVAVYEEVLRERRAPRRVIPSGVRPLTRDSRTLIGLR